MSDLSSALGYLATNERIVDRAGNVLAEREKRRGLKALFLSQVIVDAAGRPLFRVVCRTSRSTGQVDVFTPEDTPVAHIKGKSFFSRPRKFTIRDGSGLVIGRIEAPWLGSEGGLLGELLLLDNEGHLRVRGVRANGAEWAVKIQGDQPLAGPWPQLTAAFFLSRSALNAPKPPP